MGIDLGACIACLTDPHLRVNDPKCQKCAGQKGPVVGVGPDAVHHEHLSSILAAEGFSAGTIPTAAGIVMAESSGQANAESANPDGGTNIGLFQIDDKAHPQYDAKKLHDPHYNAHAANEISKGGTDWSAWATWGSGAWKRFEGQDPLITWSGSNSNAPSDVTNAATGAASSAFAAVNDLASALLSSSTWLRVGKGAVGAVLVIIGTGAIVLIIANKTSKSPVGKSAKKLAVV